MSRTVIVPRDGSTSERVRRRPAFGVPQVFVLAVIETVPGGRLGAVHRIERFETVLGRGSEAGFRVEDDEVSNQHCQLRVEGAVATIKDLGSTNGTELNGRVLRSGVAERLRHLDEIVVGGTHLLLLAGRAARWRAQRGKEERSSGS